MLIAFSPDIQVFVL